MVQCASVCVLIRPLTDLAVMCSIAVHNAGCDVGENEIGIEMEVR